MEDNTCLYLGRTGLSTYETSDYYVKIKVREHVILFEPSKTQDKHCWVRFNHPIKLIGKEIFLINDDIVMTGFVNNRLNIKVGGNQYCQDNSKGKDSIIIGNSKNADILLTIMQRTTEIKLRKVDTSWYLLPNWKYIWRSMQTRSMPFKFVDEVVLKIEDSTYKVRYFGTSRYR